MLALTCPNEIVVLCDVIDTEASHAGDEISRATVSLVQVWSVQDHVHAFRWRASGGASNFLVVPAETVPGIVEKLKRRREFSVPGTWKTDPIRITGTASTWHARIRNRPFGQPFPTAHFEAPVESTHAPLPRKEERLLTGLEPQVSRIGRKRLHKTPQGANHAAQPFVAGREEAHDGVNLFVTSALASRKAFMDRWLAFLAGNLYRSTLLCVKLGCGRERNGQCEHDTHQLQKAA